MTAAEQDEALLLLAAGEAGKAGEAERFLRQAIELRPDDPAVHFRVGVAYARNARWHQAAASLGRSLELDPTNHERWYLAAPLHAAAGDAEAYGRASREMIARFCQHEPDPVTAERTAKACSLAPGAVEDFGPVLALAERAVTGTEHHRFYRYFALSRGLAAYRAGRHAEAVEWAGRFSPNVDGVHWDAAAFSVLAMAHHRLSRRAEAWAALDRAEAILAAKMPNPGAGRPFEAGDWHDWLHAQILSREAEGLLEREESDGQETRVREDPRETRPVPDP